MDHTLRHLGALAMSAVVAMSPVQTTALGLGLGLDADEEASAAVSSSYVSAGTNANVRLAAKIANRCTHLLYGADKTRCEEIVRMQIAARGKTDVRPPSHGSFMSQLRARLHAAREEGRDMLRRTREWTREFMKQLKVAFETQVDAALALCKDKQGDEQETCIADAKVKLQAKVNAAIEALKK